jgi:hypothetical protein
MYYHTVDQLARAYYNYVYCSCTRVHVQYFMNMFLLFYTKHCSCSCSVHVQYSTFVNVRVLYSPMED